MARLFELSTPLGPDTFTFRALYGTEELGRLSAFDISAVSTNPNIALRDLLGKNITVSIELRGGRLRFLNGFVTRFALEGMVGRSFHYRMMVHPWLWFLTRSTDCRIFQDK